MKRSAWNKLLHHSFPVANWFLNVWFESCTESIWGGLYHPDINCFSTVGLLKYFCPSFFLKVTDKSLLYLLIQKYTKKSLAQITPSIMSLLQTDFMNFNNWVSCLIKMGESSSLGHETFLTYVESQNLLSVFRMNNLHTIAVPYQIYEIRLCVLHMLCGFRFWELMSWMFTWKNIG